MNKEQLEQLLKNEFKINDEMLKKLSRYNEILVEDAKVMNLTTIVDLEGVYIKHFYDSLLLTKTISNTEVKTLLDIGSGAGFPGIVLKIARPNLSITLLEPTLKRCNFLNKVIKELNLSNIKVVNERAENYVKSCREHFDYVTARAVSRLNILLELSIPFVKIGGEFLAMKGSSYLEELTEAVNAENALDVNKTDILEFEYLPYLEKRAIIIYEKKKKTSINYPRAYAQIKNKPL